AEHDHNSNDCKHYCPNLQITPPAPLDHGHAVPAFGKASHETFSCSSHQKLQGISRPASRSSKRSCHGNRVTPPLDLGLAHHFHDPLRHSPNLSFLALHEDDQELVFGPATNKIRCAQAILNRPCNHTQNGRDHARTTRRAKLIHLVNLYEQDSE